MKKVALALFFALFAYGAPSLAQDGTVLQKLKSRPELSQFTALVEASEVSKTLAQGAGVYTVFAPSNKAMQAINEVMMKRIRANKDSMHRFVGQHILAGSVLMESNLKGRQVPLGSMTGDTMMIDGRAQPVQISGAKLVTSDLLAKDGVVHVIDTAILAASLRESAAPAAAAPPPPVAEQPTQAIAPEEETTEPAEAIEPEESEAVLMDEEPMEAALPAPPVRPVAPVVTTKKQPPPPPAPSGWRKWVPSALKEWVP